MLPGRLELRAGTFDREGGLALDRGGGVIAAMTNLRTFLAGTEGADNPHSMGEYAPDPTVTVNVGSDAAPGSPYASLTTITEYDSSLLRRWGGELKVYNSNSYRFPTSYNGGFDVGNVDNNENANVWRVGFRHTGQTVAFRIDGGDSTIFNKWRLIIDGQYVSVAEPTLPGGGRRWLIVDFGSSATRDIELEGVDAAFQRKFAVAVGDTVQALPASQWRVLMLGDSFTQGTGAGWKGDELGRVAGDYLGVGDLWASGEGGTGYIATSSGTKPKLFDRLDEDLPRFMQYSVGRDVIIVAMGINDLSLGDVTSEASACFDYIRAVAPLAPVFVLGPWDTAAPSAPSAAHLSRRDEIQAVVGQRAGFLFIDPTGTVFTKSDSTHPDAAGHSTLGIWLADQIRAALAA